MEYLYYIAKKVKSGEEGAQNENLLTGIFVWVIERYPLLMSKILENSILFGEADQINNFSLEFRNSEIQFDCMDCPLNGMLKFGRLDAIFKGENIVLGLENKVVTINEPNSLYNQVEKYCKAMKRNFSSKWLMLVITPDSEMDANKELSSFRTIFPGRVCWISWQKIWHISKEIVDSHDEPQKLIINELKGAIELAKLKPFNGFTEQAISVMENLHFLDEIPEFLHSIKNIMENDEKIYLIEKGTHRERDGHEYTSSIWPEYIEKDTDGAIYYGPWFRFDEIKFSVYVELRDWAAEAHQHWKEKNLDYWNENKSVLEKKWIEQGVTLEYNASNNGYYTGYYLTISIKHHFLKGTKLAEFVRNGVISLRDNMIKPMNLKKP